ncbi:MAG: glycosyltransferase family 39 protein [Anaerolineae bacterium]|nr:glycosyltransferase family 39 protein [Anaerolineae bacterium]
MRDIEQKNLVHDYSGTEGDSPSVPDSAKCADWNSVLHLLTLVLALALVFFLRIYLLPSIPFGWHPDEAVKGIMAREVLAGKAFPVFFSAFTGRDALYIYLEAAAFALFGEGMLAGRLLSAFIGVLTVAMTYAVGKVMFNRRVGWLAAGLMSVSLWHLIASRNGYRAVIQPLVQLPVMWLLFRAWRTRTSPRHSRAWLFVVAGLFLGLTQYAYTAARIFPVLILAVVLLALALARAPVARDWRSPLLMFLVAGVVVSPLAVYFLRHPFDFYGRAEQISVFAPQFSGDDPWGRLWRSVEETARMFTVWGDPNYRFNLAGRPVFGPVDGALFYGGLVLCLWLAIRPVGRIANPTYGVRRLAYAALLFWLLIMLVPMVLSAESLPYYQRAIGALPAVYFFPVLLLDGLAGFAERYSGRVVCVVHILCVMFCVVLFAGLAAQTYQAYFVDWHTATQNDDDRRVAMVYVADYLRQVEPVDELYLSSEYGEHPTLAFLTPERYDGIHWFNAQQSLPLPPDRATAMYVLLLENPPQPALLKRVPGLRHVDVGYDRFNRPVFEVYRWEGRVFPTPSDRSPGIVSWERTFEPGDPHRLRRPIDLPVNFGDVMLFLGHDRNADEVEPGETLEVVLYWQLLQRPERHYSVFVHLLDAESRIVGEFDANSYGTKYWREDGGEMLLGYYPLRMSPDASPGEYQLEIGVYHQPTWERLPVYAESGEMVADRLLLRPVRVR